MKTNRLLLLIIKERKIMLIGAIVGLLLFMAYMLIFYVPFYTVSARLYIKNIPQNNIVAALGSKDIIQSESGFSNPLFNMIGILNSSAIASNTYDKIQQDYKTDLEKMGINNKKEWIKIYPQLISSKIEPSSDIIALSFKWPNKNNSEPVMQIVIQEFKNTNLDIRRAVEINERKYIDEQIKDLSSQLNTIRVKIKNFKLDNNTVDAANEASELTKARVDLEKQAEILKTQISYNEKKYRDLSAQIGFSSAEEALKATGIGEDTHLITLNQELAMAKQNKAKLLVQFTENYPTVLEAENQIQSLSKEIENRKKETLKGIKVSRGIYDKPSQDIVTDMARVQAESISLKAQLNAMKQGISNLLAKENLLPEKILGLDELKKQEDALLIAYSSAKQKQLEAKIQENKIVDNIVTLGGSLEPKFFLAALLYNFCGFIALGLIGALSIVWIKEDIEDKWINTEEMAEVTNQKILGVIPWVNSSKLFFNDFIQPPNSILGIAYNNIATNLNSRSYVEEAQSLAFISTVHTRDKSSVIPNLAAALARSEKTVTLIDTDFTSPSKLLNVLNINATNSKDIIDIINEINKHLRLHNTIEHKDLNDIISQALIPINITTENGKDIIFYYLCANKKANTIYDYVASRGFKMIVDFLKHYNEFVLIDTPTKPVVYPEIPAISSITDASILISAMETNREELVSLIKKLEKSNTKILGIIPREENSELEKYFLSEINDYNEAETGENNAMFVNKTANKDKN